MKRFLNFFLVFLTALVTNIFAVPWSGLWLDHRYRLVWRLPFWIEIVAAIFTLLGILIALRYCWMCAFDSFGKSSSTEALSVHNTFSARRVVARTLNIERHLHVRRSGQRDIGVS